MSTQFLLALLVIIFGVVTFVLWMKLRRKENKSSDTPARSDHNSDSPYGSLLPDKNTQTESTFSISEKGIKIGRDPSLNDIVIDHDGVSREHAWVGVIRGKVVVKDLNSINGTFVNTVDSDNATLRPIKDGDKIIIGKGKFGQFTYKELSSSKDTLFFFKHKQLPKPGRRKG